MDEPPQERTFLTTEVLLMVVQDHGPDGLGHCARCGEEWTCGPYLRAMAELRRRGVVRPAPQDEEENDHE